MKPKIQYIICSAPRSGSHLLSTALKNTGLAGFPQEHFNPWHMQNIIGFPEELIYDDQYIPELINQNTSKNGVFGTKAQFSHITNFVGLHRLITIFGNDLKYIFIKRKNKIAQAVSLAKATQTQQFMADQEIHNKPVYNYYQIWQCLREINCQEKGWSVFFHEYNIEPYIVIYEELVDTYNLTILNVFRYLGIDIDQDFIVPEPTIKKQADKINDEWISKFQNNEK
ncbi:MAG: hypothetical protein JW822_14165 [Spirochaetales bacterium]|nr:hypothetical protein [Spirochaetales bacterium]